ncbi:hypothetical protein TCAL_11317 [Tigriopus californicus]|uniref:Major facilitator superfamily (MFS) profile domain-containing protein n=1 Tax=Tigriopus californicus TaxID=6832 RepID=A0A553NCQ4_TIGCA|nr:glucose transporter type 1-like [Tigriopus californicus]TRY63220.1 hypothetical protein TCAL_11317 [Tigriopus californicus]
MSDPEDMKMGASYPPSQRSNAMGVVGGVGDAILSANEDGGSLVRRSASGVFRYAPDPGSCSQENSDNGYGHHEDDFDNVPNYPHGHRQADLMSLNFNHKLMESNPGIFAAIEPNFTLDQIQCQLSELTRSLENCQSEVYEVKQDMMCIKHEIDSVQFVKEELDDIRDSLDRMESDSERRKSKLMEQGLTFVLGFSIFSAVLGMLQFGYNTGVINAPESVIEKFIRFAYRQRYDGENMTYEASTFLYAIAVAIFALGGMMGGFMGGCIANKFGRKGGLLVNNFFGVGGAIAMGMAKYAESYELLIIGRFVIGMNCGLNTSLVPMYISEISPLTLRGGLGTINQLAVTVGLLISQILGIESLLGTNSGWPFLLGIAVFPSLLQICLLPFCPESPRYLLITKQKENQAREALRKLRNSKDIDDDIDEMKTEEQAQRAEAKINVCELLRSPSLRLPLLIAVVMQLSQQLSGINAVFYYSTNLFITTGLSESNAKLATIGIGSVMVLMTLVSIPLMDRSGRRTLHLYGLGGMFIFSIFITISFLVKELVAWIWWLSVVSTLFYVVFFAVGPGSIPWMITAELFSQGPRPAAMSVAVLINWCANFCVGIGFPTMQTALENYTFLPFSVFLAIFWIFTYKKVPETKNKTFDEIATLFRVGGNKQRAMMNCVSNMPPLPGNGCEHKKSPNEKPGLSRANLSSQEYPLLVESYPSSPVSKSATPSSEYSVHLRQSSNPGSQNGSEEDLVQDEYEPSLPECNDPNKHIV